MSKKPHLRLPHGPRVRVRTNVGGESQTRQSFNDETDINQIMARFEKTGIMEHLNTYQGQYGDFTEATDYQSSLNQVQEAQDAFNSLPSSIRSRFNNSPAEFLEFAQNQENADEMIKLGLLNPVEPENEAPPPKPEQSPSEGEEAAPAAP